LTGLVLLPAPRYSFFTDLRFTPVRLLNGIFHCVHSAVVATVAFVAVAVLFELSCTVTYTLVGLFAGCGSFPIA